MSPNEIFKRFVPEAAVDYCARIIEYYGFEFKIKRTRQSKLGDYRYERSTGKHTISINNDLNPYSFLITYLHEVAHLVTQQEHGGKVAPHGKEWKNNFKRVLQPVLNDKVFPSNVLITIQNHLNSVKASSCADPILYRVLSQYDRDDDFAFLKDLEVNQTFQFKKEVYKKLETRRTRSVCLQLSTGRKYLIPDAAKVVPDSKS